LLHRGSHHDPSVFKGSIKAQLLRIRRICSKETDRVEATKILLKALRRKGYSQSFLRRVVKEESRMREHE